ncbi:MAG: TlpA family protein disulfide reductase [Bernardetiaceae bacterium]|nr:TlpA family protein disulfide reductase [Bernardetiaceae bacterium]
MKKISILASICLMLFFQFSCTENSGRNAQANEEQEVEIIENQTEEQTSATLSSAVEQPKTEDTENANPDEHNDAELVANKPTGDEDKIILPRTKDNGSPLTFDDVLAQLSGKVIYVDFWASWCGPCRGEMPSSAKLHEQFASNDNVAFLYVSFDRSEDAWKKGIEAFDIKGIHYYPEDIPRNEVATKFKVSGIPRYMIIDKNGKVVNNNAPRPSSGAVAQALNKLL